LTERELQRILDEADQHEVGRLRHENTLLRERIETLLADAKRRPTKQQVDYVLDYAKRQHALHQASLARCVILKRKLDQLTKKAA
jgi:hypothetical protein